MIFYEHKINQTPRKERWSIEGSVAGGEQGRQGNDRYLKKADAQEPVLLYDLSAAGGSSGERGAASGKDGATGRDGASGRGGPLRKDGASGRDGASEKDGTSGSGPGVRTAG